MKQYIQGKTIMADHISICIPTYNRKEMLQRLLVNIALQTTDDLFGFSVVVVDNDPSGSSRNTVEEIQNTLPVSIAYDIETERSIPAVRNHCLRLAKGNYIGIIDDDEFPPPHWLITLYRAIQTFNVDGALGPIYPFFENTPPSWLIEGKLCDNPVPRTGTILHWSQTRTGNVLLKKDVFDKNHLCFDLSYKTGGSDQHFFKMAMNAGCRFISVEEAPVYETVPPRRQTKKFYITRALVNGYNAHKYVLSEKSRLLVLKTFLRSAAALIAYALLFPFILCFKRKGLIVYLEGGAHHLSRLCAMAGMELVKQRRF